MKNKVAVKDAVAPASKKTVGQRRISVAWPPFEQKLAAVLARLEEDQYLVISVKGTNRYVQFAGQGSFGMRVETTSNNYLSKPDQLDAEQVAALLEAGWNGPTSDSDAATPENDPDGSPNFFVEFAVPVPFESVARLTIQTLASILRVPHPLSLEYKAFEREGAALTLPELGLKQTKRVPKDAQPDDQQEDLATLLLTTLRQHTGLKDLAYDGDGDISFQYGSAQVLVRLLSGAPFVRCYSRVLHDVEPNGAILSHLNDMNAREPMVHFVVRGNAIFALSDTCAAPFVAEHVNLALSHFCVIVDGMDSLLQTDFGGQTTFTELMPSSLRH